MRQLVSTPCSEFFSLLPAARSAPGRPARSQLPARSSSRCYQSSAYNRWVVVGSQLPARSSSRCYLEALVEYYRSDWSQLPARSSSRCYESRLSLTASGWLSQLPARSSSRCYLYWEVPHAAQSLVSTPCSEFFSLLPPNLCAERAPYASRANARARRTEHIGPHSAHFSRYRRTRANPCRADLRQRLKRHPFAPTASPMPAAERAPVAPTHTAPRQGARRSLRLRVGHSGSVPLPSRGTTPPPASPPAS